MDDLKIYDGYDARFDFPWFKKTRHILAHPATWQTFGGTYGFRFILGSSDHEAGLGISPGYLAWDEVTYSP